MTKKEVFLSFDGKIFDTEEECASYENNNTSYQLKYYQSCYRICAEALNNIKHELIVYKNTGSGYEPRDLVSRIESQVQKANPYLG